jgi:hypothetical protein
MMFTTDTVHPVITRGNPTRVDLWLVRVGPGTKTAPVHPPPPVFRAPPSVSGRLALASGKVRFTRCGEGGDGIAVEDLSNREGEALVREFGAGEQGISVMVRLDGDRLREIRYAGSEGPACDRLPPDAEVEARGKSPSG